MGEKSDKAFDLTHSLDGIRKKYTQRSGRPGIGMSLKLISVYRVCNLSTVGLESPIRLPVVTQLRNYAKKIKDAATQSYPPVSTSVVYINFCCSLLLH